MIKPTEQFHPFKMQDVPGLLTTPYQTTGFAIQQTGLYVARLRLCLPRTEIATA